jgi:Tfp pilus assembly protein PilF/tRNA A-37 threonylcarbamoyl transferase component Bud32
VEPSVWASLKIQFERVSELPESEREEFLRCLGETDPEMVSLLTDLLTPGNESFLEHPPWHPAAAAGPDATAIQIGELLADRFEVESFLGAGGAGEVYRAYDRHRKKRIALKSIRASRLQDSSSMDSLRNELNTATQVSHRNICRLYDLNVAQPGKGVSFITMELLEGESLAARIRKQPLVLAEAYPIVIQLVNGLAAAHERGIVHRDLKPANVILVPEENALRAVITDFGLAREIKPELDSSITLSNELAGTPAYMAPEQLEGKRATCVSDVYALGVILFEMVTGRLPFEGKTPMVMAAARLQGKAPSPRRFSAGLDLRWERAILACLERDPAKRPQSALAVLALLEGPPVRRWPRRLLVGSLAASIASGVFVAVRPKDRDSEAEKALQQGLMFSQRRTAEGLENAIVEFRKATTREPRWAVAWAHLADAYAAAGNYVFMDPAAALDASRAAARRAIELDDHLARAHGSLAWTLSLDLDQWPKATPEFRRAIELDGRDAEVRRWFAAHLRKMGRYREAEEQVSRGMALTHSTDARLWTELLLLLFAARQLDRFHQETAEAHRLFPNDSMVESLVARSLELRKRFDEALDLLDFVQRLGMNHATVLVLKAGVAASRGDTKTARALAEQVERVWQTKPVDGILLAGVYARIGDSDRVFRTMEAAYRKRDNTLLSIATSPWLEAIHGDPRYREWLRRLHFTDQIMQGMEFKASSGVGSASHP